MTLVCIVVACLGLVASLVFFCIAIYRAIQDEKSKNILPVVLFLLLPSIAWSQGNTIELANGQMLEWVALRDKGDALEVMTATETKLIKKIDVKRISTVAPKVKLVDPRTPINLLTKVDVERDKLFGVWKMSGKGLSVESSDPQSKLVIPADVPEEYELHMTVECKKDESWGGDFCIGLVGGGKKFVAVLDADKGAQSGFELIDGKGSASNKAAKSGTLFARGTRVREVKIGVLKTLLTLTVDGQTLVSWPADYGRISMLASRDVPDQNHLFFSTSKWGVGVQPATWTVSKMILVPRGDVELTPPK